jgi:Kef-type K+ transport system membrane component KefB
MTPIVGLLVALGGFALGVVVAELSQQIKRAGEEASR